MRRRCISAAAAAFAPVPLRDRHLGILLGARVQPVAYPSALQCVGASANLYGVICMGIGKTPHSRLVIFEWPQGRLNEGLKRVHRCHELMGSRF
jgi:hypothetical protein